MPDPPPVLRKVDDGGSRGWVIRKGVPRFLGDNPRRPVSPTIFDMVVDAVLHHWVLLVMGGVVGMDG